MSDFFSLNRNKVIFVFYCYLYFGFPFTRANGGWIGGMSADGRWANKMRRKNIKSKSNRLENHIIVEEDNDGPSGLSLLL